MTDTAANQSRNEQRKRIRRSALAVALLAAVVYVGFITLVGMK